ncbi:PREDICTED: 28S ribosomal protein S18c, mitochondrial [Ceratosolen solmsi marchali]|uniref:28S ribosomal protein S18c, mitochondrial n=1 Tax=Ceratosolen solmsi marchali TaxID=326594 RepID=A0AAJ6YHT2_9HYME|nr:PREDICTED: 28S ribosomal protein S18c, mitochondrial [Ceratosolen solmsi marchali]
MNFIIYSRVLNNKTTCLLRNVNNSRVNICTSRQRPQNIVEKENDEPIEMENPFLKERKSCIFCKYDIHPDYKNVRLLSQFQSRFTGRVYGRHITGLCAKQQQRLEREIHKAQFAGLMGFMTKDMKYVDDPVLLRIDPLMRKIL